MKIGINYFSEHAETIHPLVLPGDLLFNGPGQFDDLVNLTLRHDEWRAGLMLGGGPGTPLPEMTAEAMAKLNQVNLGLEAQGGQYTADDLTPRVVEVADWCKFHNKRLYLAPSYNFANSHVEKWAGIPGVSGFMFQLMRWQADPARYAAEFTQLVNRASAIDVAARFSAQVSLVRGGAGTATVDTLAETVRATHATGRLNRAVIFYSPRDEPDLDGLVALSNLVHEI